jgi:hypothetical protein
MGRARDIASLLTTSSALATDSEVASLYTPLSSPVTSFKNKIINGGFNIWQRGTSFTPAAGNAAVYSTDRFLSQRDGTGATVTVSQQTFTPGTAPVDGYESQFFYRYAQTVAGTGATYTTMLSQYIEDVRTLAGQTATVSFWAKADTAKSIVVGFGQNFGAGGSSSVFPSGSSINVTTSWARYSVIFNIPNVLGKTIGTSSYLQLYISQPTPNTTITLDIWGVQVEKGSIATEFEQRFIGDELRMCERYLQVWKDDNKALYSGHYWSATESLGTLNFRVSMRIPPTLTASSGTAIKSFDGVGQVQRVSSSINTDASSITGIDIVAITAASTAGRATFNRTNGAGSYLWLQAEL